MKKIATQKPQNERILEMLKKLASRMEDVTIDVSSIKSDLKFVNLRLSGVEHNTEIMKVDMESLRGEMGNLKGEMGNLKGEMGNLRGEMGNLRGEMKEMEFRLGKRISNVADLITISMDQKFKTVQKRIRKIERIQQAS